MDGRVHRGVAGLLGLIGCVALGLAGCDGNSGYGAAGTSLGGVAGGTMSSGLPRDAHVKALGSADLATLCDWSASKLGGYNRRITCPDGSWVMAKMSRMACEQTVTSSPCDLTVGEIEDCTDAVTAAPCGAIPEECAPLLLC
jgi:hypothetical protein